MRQILWYLIRAPFRYFYFTWIFTLLLFKRRIPKWLKEKSVQLLDDEWLDAAEVHSYRFKA